MRYFEQLRETWDTDTLEATSDLIEAGERIVVRQLWRGEGQGPGMSLEFTAVYTLRKGMLFLIE